MAEKQTNKERLKEITNSIEAGIKELFQSERYMNYLRTMSRFHKYSFNNTMLIHMQKPDATLVTGYSKWGQKFNRHVKRGEKGIKIIAPTPFKKKIEQEKLDPDTKLPMKNNLTYSRSGDYLIPDLKLSEVPEASLGKYGRMRKKYLQENRQGLYSRLLLSEKLQAHLLEIDQAAHRRLEQMLPVLAQEAGATEELKASDPMKWTGLMNNCKAQAEEIILTELVYN